MVCKCKVKEKIMKDKFVSIILSVTLAAGMFLMPQAAYTACAGDYPVSPGESLSLNTPTDVNLPMGETAESYMAYAFKTNNSKGYYYSVLNSTLPETNPNVHIATDQDTDTIMRTPNTSRSCQIGDYKGGENNLSPDTVYYFLLGRRADKPYKANVSIVFLKDNEADTSAEASAYGLGTAISGSIDGAKDVDVWKFTTADDEYTLTATAGSNTVDLYIYKDANLTDFVVEKSVTKDGFTTKLTKLEKNTTYYIALRCAANHMEGYSHNYSFTITGKNNTNNDPEKQENQNEKNKNQENQNEKNKNQETIEPASGNKNKSTKSKNYLKTISSSKYFVTNMTTKVSANISGNKLTLTKAKGAYLFRKSKMKNKVFQKSTKLKKSKYTYKLAKNYKIVYGKKQNGTKDVVKTKAWFNKAFKKKGSMYGKYNIGVCLNKKGQVTMIYISGFDVGAEQTD